MGIFKLLTRGVAIGLVAIVVIYLGATAYANTIGNRKPYVPDATKAPYVITERNTGQQILTDKYRVEGKAYVVDSYWQQAKNGGWKLIKMRLKLDPRYFGPITVQRRSVTMQ